MNLDKQTIILLTTAITRGNLHEKTIGLFYKKLHKCLDSHYNIIHIINIDYPIKFRNNECEFNLNNTKQIFDKIIPANVHKIFIMNEDNEPNFSKAYKKVIKCIYDNELLFIYDNPLIWWMEDDWTINNFYNFIPILKSFKLNNTNNEKTAISITNNAPLCSFRGGPIMTTQFFQLFFDLHLKISDYKDPEYKVCRNIRFNETVPVYTNNIYIMCIFIHSKIKPPYTMFQTCYWWYKEKMKQMKFAKNKGIIYVLGIMAEPTSKTIHYKKSLCAMDLKLNDIDTYKKNGYVKCSIEQFNKIKENNAINYITIVPHIFSDVGRNFNKIYGDTKSGT